MNYNERLNLSHRLIAMGLLLISLGVSVTSLALIILSHTEEIVLMLIAVSITIVFALLETIVIVKGGKKESNLQKIAFNEKENINNIPLIAVGVGTAFGVGLLALGISVYFINPSTMVKASMLVVISIASYLLLNCFIYYIYLLMFKKRPLNLKDLIK